MQEGAQEAGRAPWLLAEGLLPPSCSLTSTLKCRIVLGGCGDVCVTSICCPSAGESTENGMLLFILYLSISLEISLYHGHMGVKARPV